MGVSDELVDRLRALLAQGVPRLRAAYLFGSVARGAARFDSDLDFAVDAGAPLDEAARLALVERLARLSGRQVDLVDLCRVGEPLLGQILGTGVRLFGSDESHAALMFRHVMDAADFTPYRERLLAERRRRWIGA